jgi:hypothetical protein
MARAYFFNDPIDPLDFKNLNPYIGRFTKLEEGGIVNEAQVWKMAHLSDPYSKEFKGLSYGRFTVNQKASCEKEANHSAPMEYCECGFYGFNDLNKAIDLVAHARALVLIKAEFYGKIVVHQFGLRAEEQEIKEIYLNDKCSKILCKSETIGMIKRRKNWYNVCEEHVNPTFITLEKLSYIFKIKVSTFNRKKYLLENSSL